MGKLFDGPVRTRAFWLTVFAAVASIASHFGLNIGNWQAGVDALLSFLVMAGVLAGTTGTTPVASDADKGW